MTSQLTPERSTSLAPEAPEAPKTAKTAETRERIYLQPWFLLAMVCMAAIVLLAIYG
ncbi:hypothetical protein [Mycobacterium kyorinense]|uniref:hypothetical protein n=1 Tax=Mycobacterium kyorinense TaxID=487514 RepID=UPI0012E941D9|nr:hypothetical protein [Mycobacterium kyorinense]